MAAADPSGKSRDKSKSHKGDGSTSHVKGAHGTAVTSDTSADETSGTTPVVVDNRSHRHRDTSSSSTASVSDH